MKNYYMLLLLHFLIRKDIVMLVINIQEIDLKQIIKQLQGGFLIQQKIIIQYQTIYNDNKEFLQRRIYPNVTPYLSNNHYPHPPKNYEASDEKIEVNNINYNNINIHTETKKKFLSNIYLYDFEYQELTNKYGETKTNKCIEFLYLYKASKGVEYESDYATILRWVADAVDEKEQRQEKANNKSKKSIKCNFEQREYPPEFFESLYDNIPSPTSTDTEEDEMDLDI